MHLLHILHIYMREFIWNLLYDSQNLNIESLTQYLYKSFKLTKKKYIRITYMYVYFY